MKKNLNTQKKKIHFEISERKLLLRIFDVVVVFAFLKILSYFIEFKYLDFDTFNLQWTLLLGFYILLFYTLFEMYDLQVASNTEATFKNGSIGALLVVIAFLFTPYISPILPKRRIELLYFIGAVYISLLAWRMFYIRFFASSRFHKHILVIGNEEEFEMIRSAIEKFNPNNVIMGFIGTKKAVSQYIDPKFTWVKAEELENFVQQNRVSEIIMAVNSSDFVNPEIYEKLIVLLESGIIIREYTQVYEEITHRVPVQHVGKDFYKYFPFSRSNQNQLYLIFHTLMDWVLSALGLLVFIILIPFVWIGNLFANRGKLFYHQQRVGKNGAVFEIIKLRTMIQDAEANGPVWAQQNDQRITRFGKFLRRSRIDELPQLINVMKGEMCFIGPRPERPEFIKQLSEKIPFYETRHVIKPGITGWAQVKSKYGANEEDMLEKLQYDLFYIKHRSLFLDLNILLKTLTTMIFFRGQ
ncbi:MAG: sugar transferase [Flavobacteriaceae bacterium]|nr:sugar transferase [Flavobacteriaceae bacterium]